MQSTIEKEQPARTETSETKGDRIYRVAFFGSVCFLCVVVGLLLAALKTQPYYWTEDALKAFRAVCAQQQMFSDDYSLALWQPSRYDEVAPVFNDVAYAENGYTLFTSGANSKTVLLNSHGKQVHAWEAPFSKVWKNPTLSKAVIPDHRTFVRRAHVYPNGDLLALYETPLNTPNGMGLARLDKNSNVVWAFDGNCHHDFTMNDAGKIFALTHELKASDHKRSVFGRDVNIEDFVTIVGDDGKELKKFSLLNAFYNSPHYRYNILMREQFGDLLHANTINLVGAEFAAKHENIDEGQLMVCFRNLNLVVVVDPKTEQIVWGTSGPWHFPHDPDPLPNGNILIFDNCVSNEMESHSRIVEFDPVKKEVVWSFSGDDKTKLRSDIRSTQQTLKSGNILICESDGGRMLEVTRAGKVVWQYVNPVRGGDEKQYIPIMAGVHRYQRAALPFLKNNQMLASRDNQ